MGSKAMGTIAKELVELGILGGRFPMVRYKGHAFLLLQKIGKLRYIVSENQRDNGFLWIFGPTNILVV